MTGHDIQVGYERERDTSSYRTYTTTHATCSCGWSRTYLSGHAMDDILAEHRQDVVERLLGVQFSVRLS